MNGSEERISYLETLSTQELFRQCDHYGIDVPMDLDRSFIILELVEAMAEQDSSDSEDIEGQEEEEPFSDEDEGELVDLPKSYNETRISVVLRNPVWAYVFWDISDIDKYALDTLGANYVIKLRIQLYTREALFSPYSRSKGKYRLKALELNRAKVADSYELQVGMDSREQFILLPSGEHYFLISLIAQSACSSKDEGYFYKELAQSIPFYVAGAGDVLTKESLGFNMDYSPILELSGIKEILRKHYTYHRHSFLVLNSN